MSNAFAVLFATIAQILKSVSSLFSTVDQGVGMLDTFVKDAANAQRVRSDYDAVQYEALYSEQVADRLTSQREAIQAKCRANPHFEAQFNSTLSELTAAVQAKRAARKQ